MPRARFLLPLLLIAPALLRADGLADVRATLAKMQSDQPLRARVEIKASNAGGESDKRKQQSAGLTAVIVDYGPDGIRLNWTPEQIRQSRQAAWEKLADPDAAQTDLATLGALEAGDALALVDAADPLRRWLEHATLLEDKPGTFQGKPARRLLLRVQLRLNAEARKILKESDGTLQLWLDRTGIPIAVDRDLHARFSKFFLSYRIHEHDAREFQTVGNRLIVTHSAHESSGSGLGHSEESHSAITVTLLPGTADTAH
ncbi:MAG: hypothetical protein ABI992_03375 [Chthoniobacterales bacterium]